MPISGYTSTLPDEVLTDSGVIYIGTSAIGVTKGPPKFDPGEEVGELIADGMSTAIEGAERILGWNAHLTFTMIQIASATHIGRVQPTAASGAVTGGTAYTPADARVNLTPATHYIENLRAIWEIGDTATYFAIHFPVARFVKYDIVGVEKDCALINIDAKAFIPTAGSALDCPYQLEIRTALPA